jgi:hypothetical protein
LAKLHVAVTDDFRLNLFGEAASFVLPISDGSFREPKRQDNRGKGTALGYQSQDQNYQPGWMLEVVEHGAGRFGKGFSAGMADVLPFGVRMDANAITCAAIGLGAYYHLRAHWWERVFGHTAQ